MTFCHLQLTSRKPVCGFLVQDLSGQLRVWSLFHLANLWHFLSVLLQVSGHGCPVAIGSTRTREIGTDSLTAVGLAPCPMHMEELSFNTWTMEIKASPCASPLSHKPQRLENWRGQGDADFLLNFLHWKIFQDHPPLFPYFVQCSCCLNTLANIAWLSSNQSIPRNWELERCMKLKS